MKFGILASYLTVLLNQKEASGQSFPPYSQQCQDDAGPPYLDDSETFGPDGKFHDSSEAWPVLVGPNGDQCPTPLANACANRGDAKTAYLEGPIDCNGNGWYCRILEDENFNDGILKTDLNFAYCNRTDEAADEGHCHGSADESTYYWWVRDHWFRRYNGRLRCCCNWESGDDPLTTGFLTNRCDYRRLVTQDENVDNCRDANEDHGLGFEGGCSDSVQMGQPIPEDDSKCWEVQHFGYVEGGGTPPPYPPVGPPPPPPPPPQTEAPVPPPTPAPAPLPITPPPPPPPLPPQTEAPVPPSTPAPAPLPTTPSPIPAQPTPESCEDDEEFLHRGKLRTCEWASQILCRRTTDWDDRVSEFCRDSCDYDCFEGEDCVDEEPFEFRGREKDCEWATTAWCNIRTVRGGTTRIRDYCRESCGMC